MASVGGVNSFILFFCVLKAVVLSVYSVTQALCFPSTSRAFIDFHLLTYFLAHLSTA
jgi:hypothetical protein